MSSKAKRMEEALEDRRMEWLDCCNTAYGSFVAAVNLLKGEDALTDEELLGRMERAKFPLIDDPEWMRKTAEAVGFDYEKDVVGKPLMFSHSPFNTIITPYILKDGEVIPVPIRRDGILQKTVHEALSKETYRLVDWREQ